MVYVQNEKSTGLDTLPAPANNDLIIVGDVSDSGRAKATTIAQMANTFLTYIQTSLGGLVQTVTGLNTDNSDPANPVIQISVDGVTITGLGTPGSPLVAVGGGSGAGTFDGKVKSYSLEGLEGAPILNGYQNVEAYITVNGTTINAEFVQDFLQTRNVTADWAAADEVVSYVVNQGYLYLLLLDNGTLAYRVYRYDVTDLASGGTLMTIATQTLGTQSGMVMTSNGTDYFFNYQAGNSVNDYVISRYTLSGTTLTWAADVTCGAVANSCDLIAVLANGFIYGYNITGTREFKYFNSIGTLLETVGPYDSSYANLLNWTETLYIIKSSGDDEAYRIQTPDDSSGSVTGMNYLDDFTEVVQYSRDGTDDGIISGNFISFVIGGSYAYNANIIVSELNHPGIIRLEEGSAQRLAGFNQAGDGDNNFNGLISTLNDFDVTFLNRSVRAGASFDHIIGFSTLQNFTVYVRFYNVTSATFVVFNDGTGEATTAVNIPASNTWFKTRFVYTAGSTILNVTINGVTVFNGTPTFATPNIGVLLSTGVGTANTFLDTDYVSTRLTALR